MKSPTLPAVGGCRCGRVRIRISAPPILTMACHCTGCQHMTSSAFSLSAAIPTQGFEVIAGEPVVAGLRGEDVRHYFCGDCMSWMFTRMNGVDFMVNVRATLLDEAAWFEPFVETYTSEKLPWASTPAKHSFPQFPAQDAWPGLMAAYAKT